MHRHVRRIVTVILFAAVLAVHVAIAQWALDTSARMRVAPSGARTSVRYGYVNRPAIQTRALPSESRYINRASGLMRSEHRGLRLAAGNLPSAGRSAHLVPDSLALTRSPIPGANSPNVSTIAYAAQQLKYPRSGPTPHTLPVTPEVTPAGVRRRTPASSVGYRTVTQTSFKSTLPPPPTPSRRRAPAGSVRYGIDINPTF